MRTSHIILTFYVLYCMLLIRVNYCQLGRKQEVVGRVISWLNRTVRTAEDDRDENQRGGYERDNIHDRKGGCNGEQEGD